MVVLPVSIAIIFGLFAAFGSAAQALILLNVPLDLATVVIGGLLTSTLLTLYVLPLLYPWFTSSALTEKEIGS